MSPYLPLIPLSPLTRQKILLSDALATASHALTQQKNTSTASTSTANLSRLRRLFEDVQIQQNRLDTVSKQIDEASAAILTHWHPETTARAISAIDVRLFTAIDLRNEAIAKYLSTTETSPVQRLLDWQKYLTRAVTYLLLSWAKETEQGKSHGSSSATTTSVTSFSSNDHPIPHLLRVIHYLLHTFRNFNSVAAILKALGSQEVIRVRNLWAPHPEFSSKQREGLRKLQQCFFVDGGDGTGNIYETLLRESISCVPDSSGKPTAIPWMEPHWTEIQRIARSYNTKADYIEDHGNLGLLLSAPGARRLARVTRLLKRCEYGNSVDEGDGFAEEDEEMDALVRSDKERRKSDMASKQAVTTAVYDVLSADLLDATDIHYRKQFRGKDDGSFAKNQPFFDLALLIERDSGSGTTIRSALSRNVPTIPTADPSITHWLLTRLYCSKTELVDASLQVEPLRDGEIFDIAEEEKVECIQVRDPETRSVHSEEPAERSPDEDGKEVPIITSSTTSIPSPQDHTVVPTAPTEFNTESTELVQQIDGSDDFDEELEALSLLDQISREVASCPRSEDLWNREANHSYREEPVHSASDATAGSSETNFSTLKTPESPQEDQAFSSTMTNQMQSMDVSDVESEKREQSPPEDHESQTFSSTITNPTKLMDVSDVESKEHPKEAGQEGDENKPQACKKDDESKETGLIEENEMAQPITSVLDIPTSEIPYTDIKERQQRTEDSAKIEGAVPDEPLMDQLEKPVSEADTLHTSEPDDVQDQGMTNNESQSSSNDQLAVASNSLLAEQKEKGSKKKKRKGKKKGKGKQ